MANPFFLHDDMRGPSDQVRLDGYDHLGVMVPETCNNGKISMRPRGYMTAEGQTYEIAFTYSEWNPLSYYPHPPKYPFFRAYDINELIEHLVPRKGCIFFVKLSEGGLGIFPVENNFAVSLLRRIDPIAARLFQARDFVFGTRSPLRNITSPDLYKSLGLEPEGGNTPQGSVCVVDDVLVYELMVNVRQVNSLVWNKNHLFEDKTIETLLDTLLESSNAVIESFKGIEKLIDSLALMSTDHRQVINRALSILDSAFEAAKKPDNRAVTFGHKFLSVGVYSIPDESDDFDRYGDDVEYEINELESRIWRNAQSQMQGIHDGARWALVNGAVQAFNADEDVAVEDYERLVDEKRAIALNQMMESFGFVYNVKTKVWDEPADETDYTKFDAQSLLHKLCPDRFNPPTRIFREGSQPDLPSLDRR